MLSQQKPNNLPVLFCCILIIFFLVTFLFSKDKSKYWPPASPDCPEQLASASISLFFSLSLNFKLAEDKISNDKVNKEFPAKIAVNSLNFL